MNKHLRIIGLSNELSPADKPLVIPYGAYPHKVGKVVQLINSKTAGMMVSEFNAMASRPGFKGLPVYIGHPDVKSYQDKYTDHRSYGWVTGMLANDAGQQLELQVKWNEPGVELLANEQFGYFSPNWLAMKGRPGEALPFKIISVGLTQNPMIEYLALACEDGDLDEPITPNKESHMDKFQELMNKLTAFVGKIKDGLQSDDAGAELLANEDPVAALEAYIEHVESRHEEALSLANEAVPEATQATLNQVQDELQLANEALQETRKAHAGLLLDVALQDGRITPATRRKWDEKFSAQDADFVALANELEAIDPTMKTKSVATGMKPGDAQQPTHADLRHEAMQLANEKGIDYSDAYRTCSKREKFAHLFTTEQA